MYIFSNIYISYVVLEMSQIPRYRRLSNCMEEFQKSESTFSSPIVLYAQDISVSGAKTYGFCSFSVFENHYFNNISSAFRNFYEVNFIFYFFLIFLLLIL